MTRFDETEVLQADGGTEEETDYAPRGIVAWHTVLKLSFGGFSILPLCCASELIMLIGCSWIVVPKF